MRLLVRAAIVVVLPALFLVIPSAGQTTGRVILGETDAAWAGQLGQPVAVGRDAWRYDSLHIYTRSWYTGPPDRTGANYSGYSAADYSVRYIEFVRTRRSSARVRTMMQRMLPADSVLLRRRVTAWGMEETYRSRWLAGRIRPGLAGDRPCISPWGYGPGIIKVRYYRLRGGTVRVVADLGEAHETAMDECA
jgi:hypothetical protein